MMFKEDSKRAFGLGHIFNNPLIMFPRGSSSQIMDIPGLHETWSEMTFREFFMGMEVTEATEVILL
jgi:hypothetical protein